ncbi:MAG: glycine dehydrogenase (aminomethyl-transferring) [Candidatus Lindowbacteria bacterium RIFCSPLOWO2_12_FULL_62_27]|nr:MAG: glycine dehydrogenase (aminomethyl-transferring) [Candidatus Lindowbacteria bacterium RIFCSPLOWO2_12_FULL_62_27]OGH56754.1 MAG: glycine dehydrogenase (aminomethyl-transferring) [Candidatus Lindowbacteria bacterium RIFCSPLOWO2_02_FULL_62_12]
MSRLFDTAVSSGIPALPAHARRAAPLALDALPENDLVRHHVNLSRKNLCVDSSFYPLGSCTMKYSPKAGEAVASEPGFLQAHPWQPDSEVQGVLQALGELQQDLAAVTGMEAVCLYPAAGAHGELCALKTARQYFRLRGDTDRTEVLVPENAHGTNPASAAMSGLTVVVVKMDATGRVDLADLRQKVSNRTAVLMLTNPNTLGLFETCIEDVARAVHDAGGLLYYDGANLNAILGRVRPGDMGFDMVHVNLHKTFSIPHGGGGPGAGPIGVKSHLAPYLPGPFLKREEGAWGWAEADRRSIGRYHGAFGNFLNLLKAWVYLRLLGDEGIRRVSLGAVLNANYLQEKLRPMFPIPYGHGRCMHEFVASAIALKDKFGVSAMDVAKRILDEGLYAPTVYFPLLVREALMIEPTETERRETLDRFVELMQTILREAETNPQRLHDAPIRTPVRRVDDVRAARHPILK